MQQTVGTEADALHTLYLAVSQYGQNFDPNTLSGADAKKILEDASRTEAVLGIIKSLALVRIDETDAYRSSGHRSAADYGAAKTGTSRSDAQRKMKTAKRAKRLPRTDEAMRKGDLSPEQADAITDAATVNPEAEDDLLKSAKHDDLGTLRKKAKQAKFNADRDPDARNRRIHANRELRHWTDGEGVFHSHYKSTPEAGARLIAALKPLQDAAFAQARKDGRRENPDAYAADALDNLASSTTPAADNTAEEPGPFDEPVPAAPPGAAKGQPRPTDDEPNGPATTDPSSPPPSRTESGVPGHGAPSEGPGGDRVTAREPRQRSEERSDERSASRDRGSPGQDPPVPPTQPQTTPNQHRAGPRATVHLNIDLAALQRGHLEPGDTCEIPGIGPISLTAARALLGDANIDLILKKGTDICSVVHLGRTVTVAQRRALEARDPQCIVPGCGRRHGLQIDHKTGWAINHLTTVSDLARLCEHHHTLKTLYGYTYTGGPGTWRWIAPDDPPAEGFDDTIDHRDAPADQPDLFSTTR